MNPIRHRGHWLALVVGILSYIPLRFPMSTPTPVPAAPATHPVGHQLLSALRAALAPVDATLNELPADLRTGRDPLRPLAALAQVQVSLLKAFPTQLAGLEADLAQLVADEAHKLLAPKS